MHEADYPFTFKEITSTKNHIVKTAVKLRKRKFRESEKKTVLEGYREISRALEFGIDMEICFFCEKFFLGTNEFPLITKLADKGTLIIKVPDYILRKLAYRDRPEGLIAIAYTREHLLQHMPVLEKAFYLIAERIEKPGNLGAMLRAADASGATGLILCDKWTDIYNPNTIRASTAAVFALPIAETTVEELKQWLHKYNIKTIAADPYADILYTEIDMASTTIALIIGSEQYGLSDFWKNNADYKVKIPMAGKIDSLNAATAAAVLLYEAVRQRNEKNCLS